jgi:signal peptidase I
MTQTAPTRLHRLLALAGRLVDVVLLAVIAVGLSSVVLGRIVPLLGHPVYVVAGPSMTPSIGVGAAVILDPVAPADLAVGDVVSLRSGPAQAVFTHRIVRLAERDGATWIETRGDANPEPDPSITPASAVIGRVTWVVPAAGYVLALLSTVPGLVLILSAGAALMVLGWWLDTLAAERRRRPVAIVSTAAPETAAAAPDAGPAAPEAVPVAAAAAVAPSGSIPATALATPARRRQRRAALARSRP